MASAFGRLRRSLADKPASTYPAPGRCTHSTGQVYLGKRGPGNYLLSPATLSTIDLAGLNGPVPAPETGHKTVSPWQLPTLPRKLSTIGLGGLNGPVRNGKACSPSSMTTTDSRCYARFRYGASRNQSTQLIECSAEHTAHCVLWCSRLAREFAKADERFASRNPPKVAKRPAAGEGVFPLQYGHRGRFGQVTNNLSSFFRICLGAH